MTSPRLSEKSAWTGQKKDARKNLLILTGNHRIKSHRIMNTAKTLKYLRQKHKEVNQV